MADTENRFPLAVNSVLNCVIWELRRKGLIDFDSLVQKVEETAAAHRANGDPDGIADMIHAIGVHMQSISDPAAPTGP